MVKSACFTQLLFSFWYIFFSTPSLAYIFCCFYPLSGISGTWRGDDIYCCRYCGYRIHSFETGKYEFQHLMDICKVYRGLDSPCKIKGLLSHYFYIVFCAYLVSFVFVLFSFSSILQKGTVLSFLMEAVIELGIPTALYVYFYRKSDKVKIRKDNRVITISNRGLYRALNQRRYGQ